MLALPNKDLAPMRIAEIISHQKQTPLNAKLFFSLQNKINATFPRIEIK